MITSSALLTCREREILHLVAHEHSTKDIAKVLFLSTDTINSHRQKVMSKLEVRNTAGMVRVAYQYFNKEERSDKEERSEIGIDARYQDPWKRRISKRELEVLSLIANEHTTKEIAQALSLSNETINSHRQNLLRKLKVKNTAGLIRVAFEERILN